MPADVLRGPHGEGKLTGSSGAFKAALKRGVRRNWWIADQAFSAVKGWGMSYHLRFFFEYGVDTPLWPHDLDSPYGYPCAPEKLPLTPATRNELTKLADLYQSSLDWDHPAGPSPWTRDQQESFRSEADIALEALRRELGDDWTVEDRRG